MIFFSGCFNCHENMSSRSAQGRKAQPQKLKPGLRLGFAILLFVLPVRAAGKISREVSLKEESASSEIQFAHKLTHTGPSKETKWDFSDTLFFFYCGVHIFDKGQMHREGKEKCMFFFFFSHRDSLWKFCFHFKRN
ncbi:hypothetical protein HJG60_011696 [Phyllostomus discolor]|uniref:Uncharacterized protein n=1 Tax=Phyllostomus discolor TaxID=89673 RepID=A0A833ZYJ2_9CHIR|nr:hypothetical protein HJG60_011696 [Phyllostomus discolor]